MGIYAEHFTRTSRTEIWGYYEVYRQSVVRYWAVRLLDRASRLLIQVHLENRIDDVLDAVHRMRCHDDCRTGEVSRRKPGSTAPRPMSGTKQQCQAWTDEHFTTSIEAYCARLPLGAQIDVSLFCMSQKNRQLLGRAEEERRPRQEPDWAEDASLSAEQTLARFDQLDPEMNTGPKA